jgi:hypothetical protein
MLWGSSGNICARCKKGVVEDPTETDDASLVGEEAHICSKSKDGPRFDDPLPIDQRDFFANLLLLCNTCHKIVDDQVGEYTIAVLRKMKSDHAEWVKETLGAGIGEKSKDDLTYSSYVDEWASRADIDNWKGWIYGLLANGRPRIYKDRADRLDALRDWLQARIWPNRYPLLEHAFENFRRVLNALMSCIYEQCDLVGDDMLWRSRNVNPDKWDDDDYDELERLNEYRIYIIMDLTMELTRAANYICDRVRQFISSSYRVKEGHILAMGGPFSDGSDRTWTLIYEGDARTEIPFPGLEAFKKARLTRPFAFGVNEPEE